MVLKCCWPLKLERENVQLLAWQLFHVDLKCREVGRGAEDWAWVETYGPRSSKFIDTKSGNMRRRIYEGGTRWHHVTKGGSDGIICEGPWEGGGGLHCSVCLCSIKSGEGLYHWALCVPWCEMIFKWSIVKQPCRLRPPLPWCSWGNISAQRASLILNSPPLYLPLRVVCLMHVKSIILLFFRENIPQEDEHLCSVTRCLICDH